MFKQLTISLDKLPFTLDGFVGDLFYEEYPVTSVYDVDGIPLITEWVDVNETNELNKFFAYLVPKIALKQFMQSEISHWELMRCAVGGTGFLYEEDLDGKHVHIEISSPSSLRSDYIPLSGSMYNAKEVVDQLQIQQHFKLNTLEKTLFDANKNIREISKEHNSEVINLHLRKGKGIGFGKVSTRLLGDTLLKFDKLYREVALDETLGRARGDISLSKTTSEQYQITSTEVVVNQAASYSVFIKPLATQLDMFEDESVSAKIAQTINKIFKSTSDMDEISQFYDTMSDYVFRSYKEFLTDVVQKEIELDINWYNPVNQNSFDQSFNLAFANKVLLNIKNISSSKADRIEVKGKFTAINIGSAHYRIITNEEESYVGYFDVLLRDNLSRLNFTSFYDIVINQSTSKEAGQVAPVVSNTIMSCLEIEE